jgi:hypothetical protein
MEKSYWDTKYGAVSYMLFINASCSCFSSSSKRIIFAKQLQVQIRDVALQQGHCVCHHWRYHRRWRIVALRKHLPSELQHLLLEPFLFAKSLQPVSSIPLPNHQLVKSSWFWGHLPFSGAVDAWAALRSSVRVAVEAQTTYKSWVTSVLDSWAAQSIWSATCQEDFSLASAMLAASSLKGWRTKISYLPVINCTLHVVQELEHSG